MIQELEEAILWQRLEQQRLEKEEEEFFRQQQEEEEAARIEQQHQEEVLRQQEEEEAARIQLLQEQHEQEQQHQEEVFGQQQEEDAAQVPCVSFNFEQQQHVTSAKHFSSGQRCSPKTSSNHEMSKKVRDSMFDSIVETRKQARDKQRRSNRVCAREFLSKLGNQLAPSAPEHQRERDVLDALEGEFNEELLFTFPSLKEQD